MARATLPMARATLPMARATLPMARATLPMTGDINGLGERPNLTVSESFMGNRSGRVE